MSIDNYSGIQRIPPNDAEAEQAVLSSMIYDREAIATALELLAAEDFYRPDNGAVFEAMAELFNASVPVDVVTLNDRLVRKGILDQVGGVGFIANLVTGAYTSANVRHYGKIVAEKSMLRKLIKAGNAIAQAGYEGSAAEDLLESAEKSIYDIAQNRRANPFIPIKDILGETVKKIEKTYLSQERITGVATGFTDFDNKTAGLQPADLILIAARPSMGKTAIGLNIAQFAAVKNNVVVAIFTMEMSKEQLVSRMICAQTLVDSHKMRTGALDETDFDRIYEALKFLTDAPIYIDDTSGITANEIRAKCRRLKLEKGLGLVVVDYLQLMSGVGRAESRQQEISEISRALKGIAKELDVPVLAMSQLSRACETRADRRPILSDLRESGAIEQDADLVAFLYRDEYYYPETERRGIAEINIAKQRNGATGTVDLAYYGQYTKFGDLEYNSL